MSRDAALFLLKQMAFREFFVPLHNQSENNESEDDYRNVWTVDTDGRVCCRRVLLLDAQAAIPDGSEGTDAIILMEY